MEAFDVFERGHTQDQLGAFDHQCWHHSILTDLGSCGIVRFARF